LRAPLPSGSKKTGDTVEKDEPLFEISTDKVDAEIPSPVAGVLLEIKAAEGETVEINTVVALIGEPGSVPASPALAAPARTPAPVASKPTAAVPDARLLQSCPAPAAISAPRRWCAALPKTTTLTSAASPAPAPKAASPRTTFSPTSASRAPALQPPSFSPKAPPRLPSAATWSPDQNARHHRPAHGGEPGRQPARPQCLQRWT